MTYNHEEFLSFMRDGFGYDDIRDLGNDYVLAMSFPEDIDPDTSYIDDDNRLKYYGVFWSLIGVECTLYYKGIDLGSDAVFGVESDGGKEYFEELIQENLLNIKARFGDTRKERIKALEEEIAILNGVNFDEHS